MYICEFFKLEHIAHVFHGAGHCLRGHIAASLNNATINRDCNFSERSRDESQLKPRKTCNQLPLLPIKSKHNYWQRKERGEKRKNITFWTRSIACSQNSSHSSPKLCDPTANTQTYWPAKFKIQNSNTENLLSWIWQLAVRSPQLGRRFRTENT